MEIYFKHLRVHPFKNISMMSGDKSLRQASHCQPKKKRCENKHIKNFEFSFFHFFHPRIFSLQDH